MRKVYLSVLNFLKARFCMGEAPKRLCVNCGLPSLNDHVHCSRLEICGDDPSPLCNPCATESGYTFYKCELVLLEVQGNDSRS